MRFAVTALFLLLSICASAQSSSSAPVADTARDTVSGPGFTLTLPPNVEMDIRPTNDLEFAST